MTVGACRTIAEILQIARSKLQRLTPSEAYEAMREDSVVLVDTRSADYLAVHGAIPGALHIPLNVLEWRADPASDHRDPLVAESGRRIVLICAEGYASSLAAVRLHELGFRDATDVVGGFEAWRAQGLPVAVEG